MILAIELSKVVLFFFAERGEEGVIHSRYCTDCGLPKQGRVAMLKEYEEKAR